MNATILREANAIVTAAVKAEFLALRARLVTVLEGRHRNALACPCYANYMLYGNACQWAQRFDVLVHYPEHHHSSLILITRAIVALEGGHMVGLAGV